MPAKDQRQHYNHPNFNREDKEEKVSVVINTHAVEYPRAMVVMSGYAAATSPAVFTPHRAAYHTCCAEICLVKAP